MAGRPALRRLAERLGILASYTSQQGRVVRTPDRARVALARAMGLDAASEAACRRALDGLTRRMDARALEPVRVVSSRAAAGRLAVRWPGAGGAREWTLALTLEDGTRHERAGRAGGRAPATLRLPVVPPVGYHTLELIVAGRGAPRQARQQLIVTPSSCPRPGARQALGLTANLYTLRSRTNWGIGDTGDLRALVDWGAGLGAAFVGVNPLHALGAGVDATSPYSPVSRLYRDPMYIDVARVPELAETPRARRHLASVGLRRELATLRAADTLDYERLRRLKRPVLGMLHATFEARHRARGTARGRAFAAYCARQGPALIEFARFAARTTDASAWRGRSRPTTGAAAIGLHCWLQFELDRQLADTARAARACGMPLGLYQDLALGSLRGGSDTATFPGLFVDEANLGAPPDDYSRTGQDWGLPPLHPQRLVEDAYRYWILLVRNALAHTGVLRLDHVMGLFRQYWIPRGRSGTEGAYVRFPGECLLGILALEAARAGALIVGEDIGTVPRGFSRILARWGVLSTRVLYFERTRRGGFRSSARYPARAIVSANNHDLPPLAGWWQGRDLELRARAGLLDRPGLDTARRERIDERRALVRRLAAERCLPAAEVPARTVVETGTPIGTVLAAATHRLLRRTPAALIGISLDDLGGEVDPVNLPGVTAERYPSWRRRMRRSLEELAAAADVRRVLGPVTRRRGPGAARRTKGGRHA